MALGLFPDFLIAQEAKTSGRPVEIEKTIAEEVASLSLDEKVGQLLMLGFPQSELDAKLKSHILKLKTSSFILFKRNIPTLGQAARFNHELRLFVRTNLKTEPFIAVDQEGGTVTRIQTSPMPPSAFSVGLTQNSDIAHRLGLTTGMLLRRYGFNMNLAPVLDIADPNENTFIGLRSFSSNPDMVALLTSQYSKGLVDSGVMPTAKHFPGMTGVVQDPHHGIVESQRTFSEIQEADLLPYKSFAQLGTHGAVMISHLIYPSLDATKTPALFSRRITHDLLRDQLKFQGLVITDDIQMKSSLQIGETTTNAIESLRAGADILILSWSFHDQEHVFDEIKKAVISGRLPIEQVNEKVSRILAAKRSFTNADGPLPPLDERVLASNKLTEIDQQITDIHSSEISKLIRQLESPEKVCVYSSNKGFIDSFRGQFKENSKLFHLNDKLQAQDLSRHLTKNNCDLNLITVYGKKSAYIVSQVTSQPLIKKTIVINFSSPSVLSKIWPEKQTLNFGFPHIGTGIALAKEIQNEFQKTKADLMSAQIQKNSDDLSKNGTFAEQAPDRPELERPRVERIPTEYRPKTH